MRKLNVFEKWRVKMAVLMFCFVGILICVIVLLLNHDGISDCATASICAALLILDIPVLIKTIEEAKR